MGEIVCTRVEQEDAAMGSRERGLARRAAALGYDLWRIGGGEGSGPHEVRDGRGRYARVVWELWEEGASATAGVGGTFDISDGRIPSNHHEFDGFWPYARGGLDLIEEQVARMEE